MPPPHREPSYPKPPRRGGEGRHSHKQRSKTGIERSFEVQETLLQEVELLCWKEQIEISKQNGEEATNACAESPPAEQDPQQSLPFASI